MKKTIIIHPFLFALYPILTLYSYNIQQLPFRQTFLPAAIVTGGTLILFVLLGLIIKNYQKSGIIVSAFLLMFFSYGHTSDFIRYMSLLIFIVGAYFLLKSSKSLSKATLIINMTSIALILISIIVIMAEQLESRSEVDSDNFQMKMVKPELNATQISNLPDIYYIILDGYARADVLEQIYGFDNSGFRNHMKEVGFRIAEKSRSNYCQTLLSLSSALNMIYLDKLANSIGPEEDNRRLLMDMIKNNYVFDFLRQYGYKIMATATGYSGTEVRNSDYFLSPGLSLNEFENALINYTPIPNFLKEFPLINQYSVHRNIINSAFEQLANPPDIGAPKFVFAHIVAPHPPFVFGFNGEPKSYPREFSIADGSHYLKLEGGTRVEYIKSYCGQLNHISSLVEETVNSILSRPGKKPIIIIQGDHGPGSLLDWDSLKGTFVKERLSIFNAYYLPHCTDSIVYDDITPVNSFRTILNYYFGTNFKLLKDKSYYSTWDKPYRFYDVTEKVNSNAMPRILFR